jgi:hypothetical protein
MRFMSIWKYKPQKYELVIGGIVGFLVSMLSTACYLAFPNSKKGVLPLVSGVLSLAVGIRLLYRAKKMR